jgi:nucleoside phosphorylase
MKDQGFLPEFFIDLLSTLSSVPESLVVELVEYRAANFTESACESLGHLLTKKRWRRTYDLVKTKFVRRNQHFNATIRVAESSFEYSLYDYFAQGARLMAGMSGFGSATRRMNSEKASMASDGKNDVILILTALHKEYHAVREFLDPQSIRTVDGDAGVKYEVGVFSEGDNQWHIAIATTGANNYSSSTECQKAVSFFRPKIAIFSGIAGGIKDVKIGDVVVVTKLCGYEPGKSADKFSSRIEPGQSDYTLQKECEHMIKSKDTEWRKRVQCKKPKGFRRKPDLYVGPIASGEQVVASTTSTLYQMIRERCNDAIAVEMEGVGFYNSCRSNSTPGIMIRGISDLLDDKSVGDENERQQYAAATAAALTFELVSRLKD